MENHPRWFEWWPALLLTPPFVLSAAVVASPETPPCRLAREYVYAGDRLLASVGPDLPAVSFVDQAVSVDEGQAAVSLGVRLSTADGCPTGSGVDVPFFFGPAGTASPGEDYDASPGVLSFPAGTTHDSVESITLSLVRDHAIEPDESFSVFIANPGQAVLGSPVEVTVTIVDNDTPLVSFDAPEARVREDGTWLSAHPTVRVTMGDEIPLPHALEVPFIRTDRTTQGSADATLGASSPLSFASGAASGTSVDLQLSAVPDAIIEGDEALGVELAASAGYRLGTRTATLTIEDDDFSPPLALYTVAPCRLVDTRNAAGPHGGPALAAGQVRTFQVTGACGVPATARAVVLGLAVITPSAAGNLGISQPGTAVWTKAADFAAGDILAAGGHFLLDPAGRLDALANMSQGTLHVVLDVLGYLQ